jgi:hypothetical protein
MGFETSLGSIAVGERPDGVRERWRSGGADVVWRASRMMPALARGAGTHPRHRGSTSGGSFTATRTSSDVAMPS